ncbi:MAG TPA: chemotaxis protein CheX [Mycobacteriales bacterium]|nr:chemotaxis protein CheX [Mycobacteriales bacterium]
MTSESITTGLVVTVADLTEITIDVWSSFLGERPEPAAEPAPTGGARVTGCVHISGTWQGSVMLSGSQALAAQAAAGMFGTPVDELADAEVSDAFGELTNMVGGNVKGMLEGFNALSIPVVTSGADFSVRVPGEVVIAEALLTIGSEQLKVTALQR